MSPFRPPTCPGASAKCTSALPTVTSFASAKACSTKVEGYYEEGKIRQTPFCVEEQTLCKNRREKYLKKRSAKLRSIPRHRSAVRAPGLEQDARTHSLRRSASRH